MEVRAEGAAFFGGCEGRRTNIVKANKVSKILTREKDQSGRREKEA